MSRRLKIPGIVDGDVAEASMRHRAIAWGFPSGALSLLAAILGHAPLWLLVLAPLLGWALGAGAVVLVSARRVPEIPATRELYATSRLVDLLLGPLGDRGRAVVELRRLAERHRGTPEAAHAERAIARLRAELFANA